MSHHDLVLTDSLVSTVVNSVDGGETGVQAVDLDYVKNHVRSLTDADDDLLSVWIDAAASYFFEQTGRSPLTQTRIAYLDAFPFYGASGSHARIELPHPPLRSVLSVQYLDGTGTLRSFDDGASPANPYWSYLAPAGDFATRGSVEPLYGMTWPTARRQTGSVQITYTCGYADTPDGVPKLARNVLCLLVAHFDQFRSAVHEARRGQVLELPYGVEYLMDGFKFSAMGSQELRAHHWPHLQSGYFGPWGPWS